jgi:hypothetical protein
LNLLRELELLSAKEDMAGLENEFVKVAKSYSARQGISYGAWRSVGVPAAVLKRAGVGRAAS